MSITIINKKGKATRYRYEFKRTINGKRGQPITKLLPAGTTEKDAYAYSDQQDGINYAAATGVASGAGQANQIPLIASCVLTYLQERVPYLKQKYCITKELALLADGIAGKTLAELAKFSRDYIKEETARGMKPATIKNRLAYLRSAVNYCAKEHAVCQDEMYGKRMTLPAVQNTRTTTIDYTGKLDRLLDACRDNDELRALILFAMYTGFRWRAELLRLQPEHIANGQITLPWALKNGTPHSIPLHPKLAPLLHHLPFDKQHSREYYRDYKLAIKRAKLGNVTMHDLRRTLASTMISAGESPEAIMQTLNQSSAAARRYQWVSNPGKARIINALPG